MTDPVRPSFDDFFEAHYGEVVRALALAVGDRHRAEDAAQEAFAQAYRRWSRVAGMDRPVGWVLVVGMNRLRRDLGRAERDRGRALGDSSGRADPEVIATSGPVGRPGRGSSVRREPGDGTDVADRVASDQSLRAALEQLAPRQRATVVLRYLCDLPTDQVARALRCSPGTVKSALHAALANLRVELSPEDEDLVASAGADEGGDDHGR